MLYNTFPQKEYGKNEYLIECAHCRYDFLERDLTKCAGQDELVCETCLGYGDFEPLDRGNPICLECAGAYIRGDLSDDPPCSACGEPTDANCEHCGRSTCSEDSGLVRGPDEIWCNDCRVVEDYVSMIRSGVPIRAFQGLVREYGQVMERRGAEYNRVMNIAPETEIMADYCVLLPEIRDGDGRMIISPWAIARGTQPVIWLDYSGTDPEHPELLWARELAKTLNSEVAL